MVAAMGEGTRKRPLACICPSGSFSDGVPSDQVAGARTVSALGMRWPAVSVIERREDHSCTTHVVIDVGKTTFHLVALHH